jgi:hypothetical protein
MAHDFTRLPQDLHGTVKEKKCINLEDVSDLRRGRRFFVRSKRSERREAMKLTWRGIRVGGAREFLRL